MNQYQFAPMQRSASNGLESDKKIQTVQQGINKFHIHEYSGINENALIINNHKLIKDDKHETIHSNDSDDIKHNKSQSPPPQLLQSSTLQTPKIANKNNTKIDPNTIKNNAIIGQQQSLGSIAENNTIAINVNKMNKNENCKKMNMNGHHKSTTKPSHKSKATDDPLPPIISLIKFKEEFKSVSQAAFRFQFVCDAYRRCKAGSVKEKDFSKLEEIVNFLYTQLHRQNHIPNHNHNHHHKLLDPTQNTTQNGTQKPPSLSNMNKPIVCSKCSTHLNQCFTTCSHPLCIKCLVNIFTHPPRSPKWYVCGHNGCNQLLPPQAHFFVLSYKPPSKAMLDEYTQLRNCAYKNMLKVVGEYFSLKLKYYSRWRKCENCDFGFLADPDVHWYQVFELKCVVCQTVQRVQLIGPEPCSGLSMKRSYYPSDTMFKCLVFIRHGQAQNNVTPHDMSLLDPNLTSRGKQQCAHLSEFVGDFLDIECILSSVMNRCLQTACIAFYNRIQKNKKIPFVALECLRERLSPHYNRREKISSKVKKYQEYNIDFGLCKADSDVYFDEEKKNEKYELMNERAWQFYVYLLKRKEKCIAVVSHEGMLQCLLNVIESNDKSIRRSLKNAEARVVWLSKRK